MEEIYAKGVARLTELARERQRVNVEKMAEYLKTLDHPTSVSTMARELGLSRPTIKRNLQSAFDLSQQTFRVDRHGPTKIISRIHTA